MYVHIFHIFTFIGFVFEISVTICKTCLVSCSHLEVATIIRGALFSSLAGTQGMASQEQPAVSLELEVAHYTHLFHISRLA